MAHRKSALGKYKRVLEVDPESLDSILPLTLLPSQGKDDEEPEVPLTRDDWQKLVQILKGQVDQLKDPTNKILAMQHMADIYEHELEDPTLAFHWWSRSYLFDPQSSLSSDEMERLARVVDDWEPNNSCCRWRTCIC